MIPNDAPTVKYVQAMKYQPTLRTAVAQHDSIFSSEEGRATLEQQFLVAGVKIRRISPYLNEYQRPLGNSVLETLGFGTLIATFRNCPNNAPLALWAGNPWHPLFPRRTN
jgi:hypothetical protein